MSDSRSSHLDASTLANGRIIDVRRAQNQSELANAIVTTLSNDDPIRSIPTMILYDRRGLELFDDISRNVPEYYLTNAEIDILETQLYQIVDYIKDNSIIIELGAGSLRKTELILRTLDLTRKNITYYALDLDEPSLIKALDSVPILEHVRVGGILGTYDEGMDWIGSLPSSAPRCIMWLGSSIGNLDRDASSTFLRELQERCLRPGDLFLLGADRRNEPSRVATAYNDPKGITREFIMNGLDHLNTIFGAPDGHRTYINRDDFEYISHYDPVKGRHEAYYGSLKNQIICLPLPQGSTKISIRKNERIHIEYSYKYSASEIRKIVHHAGMTFVAKFTDSRSEYDLHLVQKPPFFFPLLPQNAEESNLAVPSLDEFRELWTAWDLVTKTMIPKNLLLVKPISLRHPFIFYKGHIPAFFDTKISQHFKLPLTEPVEYADIFERGIDPDVDEPSKCHNHSRVPAQWPSEVDVTSYAERVRSRAISIIEEKRSSVDKRWGRILSMAFEHEAMHLETILYMILQCDGTLPPAFVHRPQLLEKPVVAEAPFIMIPAGNVALGTNDNEDADFNLDAPFPRFFGWDNEKPERHVQVEAFRIQARPVCNSEYLSFLKAHNHFLEYIPKSWRVSPTSNLSKYSVHTVFGDIPFSEAKNMPVSASFVQAEAYASWKNARLPTEPEYLRVRNVHGNKKRNIGFVNWMPMAMSSDSDVTVDIGSDGWEWTSTEFTGHDGFQPSSLYPGYSGDFFDGKHMVMLGGSWATHPRIAMRNSFRNWYQKKYEYMFSCFRLVVDARGTWDVKEE